MKLLVMSCDKNQDLFFPYNHCIEKYWPGHPEVIYSTESIVNPYYKTICSGNKSWGLRIKDCLDKIDDEFILLTLDDIFIREYVNDIIPYAYASIMARDNKIGYINFEGDYRKFEVNEYDNNFCNIFDTEKEKYRVSVMMNLFKKDCLYRLANDVDAWGFELQETPKEYTYLITKKEIIKFGHKEDTICNWGIVKGKWTKECLDFFKKENVDIDLSKRGVVVKPCFGIVSYFPWDQPARKERQDRLDRLIKQLSEYWPNIPIIIISQQWKYYNPEKICKNKLIRFDYPKLGILKARQELRKHFLESDYDYLIMFDDDAIIKADSKDLVNKYIEEIEKHLEGFCFIRGKGSSKYTDYNDSQLNLCAISRWIYEHEPIPNIDPQKSEAFEDRIWSTLLHFKYSDKEFDAPKGIYCTHFKNPNEKAPSTWSAEKKFNWSQMRQNTRDIEDYIAKNKELPEQWKK